MSLFLLFGLLVAFPAYGQITANNTGLTATAGASSFGSATSLPVLIGRLLDIVVGLSGLLLFLLFTYAGIIWMTAQGDPAKVKKAQGMLSAATIGLIITLSAFAITNFVVTNIVVSVSDTSVTGAADDPTFIIEDETP